ncbi:MAG: hypothetical protein GX767_04580, partial [Firmicutes bacterium]|nr:hypothetical protein [Bacillota bacterium]
MCRKNSSTGIIGLGYVGLPLLMDFCEAGLTVIGFDIDEEKIKQLEKGQSYIGYIPADDIAGYVKSGVLKPTSDFKRLREVDNIIITVPTPLNEHREPDLGFVE